MKTQRKTQEEKFWERVDKAPGHGRNGDCWVWTKGTSSDGYGMFYIGMRNGKKHYVRSPRFAYTSVHGEIPHGMIILHSCDNIRCCNPAHLSIGTHRDNQYDMHDKCRGTVPRKMTESQVIDLIRRYRSGEKSSVLAAEYGITIDHVSRLHRGERWAHVQKLLNEPA